MADADRRTPGATSRASTPERPGPLRPVRRPTSPVAMDDRWFPGPLSHPYPGVSNCRTDQAFDGRPAGPGRRPARLRERRRRAAEPRDLVGLPEPPDPPSAPIDPGLSTDDFQRAGHPGARELLGARRTRASQEDVERPPPGVPARRHPVHGLLVRAVGRPERATSRRAPTASPGNEYLGYDWGAQLHRSNGDGDVDLPEPAQPVARPCRRSPTTSTCRMRAQVQQRRRTAGTTPRTSP